MVGNTEVVNSCEVTYLTNACGEETGYGTLDVLEADYKLVGFEDGPGVLLTYIAEINGQKVLLANLEVAHKDPFWSGEDTEFRSVEEARQYCTEVMTDVHSRLVPGAFLVPLDEGDPGRFVVGLAIPLERVASMEHGKEMLAVAFGSHAEVEANERAEHAQREGA